jgi:hypothetical protein
MSVNQFSFVYEFADPARSLSSSKTLALKKQIGMTEMLNLNASVFENRIAAVLLVRRKRREIMN